MTPMTDDAPPPSEAPDADPDHDLAPGNRDYAITRLTPERHGKAGWQVALIRRGRVVQSCFLDRVYGGREAALHVARAYRDAVLEVLPPLSRRDMRRIVRRNRPPGSAVPGVAFQAATDARPAYWVATIELPGEPPRRRRRRAPDPPTDRDAPNADAGAGEGEGELTATGLVRPRRKPSPRRKRVRYFSVDKLGHEEAQRRAEAERERMLAALEDGDRPALRSVRAAELDEVLRGGGRPMSTPGRGETEAEEAEAETRG